MAKEKNKNLYDSKEFFSTRKIGSKFHSNERKKIEILKDNVGHWIKGNTYEMFVEKADFLIKKGLAKEVK